MTNPIYVDDSDPVGTIETFITAFKIEEKFHPLARMLRRFARRIKDDAPLTAAVPTAFAGGGWSVTDLEDGTGFTLTITTLPAANGSALVAAQYRLDDGDWVNIDAATGDTAVLVDAGSYEVDLRVRNSLGYSAVSAKTATVT